VCSSDLNTNTTTGSSNGSPYIRGTWMGSPFKEDGAPQSGTTFANVNAWGAVPRASSNQTGVMGGYWIDQNSGTPKSTWAYTSTTIGLGASLCAACHGTNISTIGSYDGSPAPPTFDATFANWNPGQASHYNGHANSVRGGTPGSTAAETAARNIFNGRGGSSTYNTGNPWQHYALMQQPGSDNRNSGFRGAQGNNYQPIMSNCPTKYNSDEWGVDETGSAFQANYHKFPCSKCHNPHASRLPRLMITNCLDTRHETFDNNYQLANPAYNGPLNSSRSVSNWTSAQNCHRRGGVDGTPAGAVVGTGSGWNSITPW
jgi:hypothetical protein